MAGEKATNKDELFKTYQPVKSRSFGVSLLLEFLCVALFQFLGGSVTDPRWAPWTNGLSLAVLVYISANLSGGHLNPAVTVSMLASGNYPALHSALYVVLQVCGAIAGAAMSAALQPNSAMYRGDGQPGCFDSKAVNRALSNGQIFGWEAICTFVLISTVYACGVTKPGHGSFTPLAVGLSLVACATVGGPMTGAALNPARVLGPLAVFGCGAEYAWVFILAQLTAALVACFIFGISAGFGPLFPFVSMRKYGLKKREALRMWVTGSAPVRLVGSSHETLNAITSLSTASAPDIPKL